VRHLYLAATGQNRGKTTASLGLVHALIEAGLRTGFTKPVGPRSGSGAGARGHLSDLARSQLDAARALALLLSLS